MKFPSAKLGLLGVAVVVFTGCSDGEAPTSEGTEPQPEVRSITQGQKVTVSQGTNMALAISPDGNRISISLQGVLFTLPVAGGSAEPITDEYHDARERREA